MKQHKSELQNLLSDIAKQNRNCYRKNLLQDFNQNLYKALKVDVNNVKILNVTSIKEIKNYVQKNKLENIYLVAMIKEHDSCSAILTDYKSKTKRAVIGYYQYEKVRLQKIIEAGHLVFILQANENDVKEITELKNKRQIACENSDADINSVYYRHREAYGTKDKSGYCNRINQLYKKLCNKFLKQDFDVILQYVSNIEVNLLKHYHQVRTQIYLNPPKYIYTFWSGFPNFENEIKYIRTALNELKKTDDIYEQEYKNNSNKTEEEWKKYIQEHSIREIYRNFIKIKENELYFKQKLIEYKNENIK